MVPFKATATATATATALLTLVAGVGFFSLRASTPRERPLVVVGVSEWGALATQLVSPSARVVTLLQNPNADPHEHEATVTDAARVSRASVVVENGAGYDSWLTTLVSASATHAHVINVAELAHVGAGENPHLFYSPRVARLVVRRLAKVLGRYVNRAQLRVRETTLLRGLFRIDARVRRVRAGCRGTRVAATEDVATYLLSDMGLRVVTPEKLRVAIGNGVDPSISDLATALRELTRRPALLIDNVQTQTPLTAQLVSAARTNAVPVVAVRETMVGHSYVRFLSGVVQHTLRALHKSTGCV